MFLLGLLIAPNPSSGSEDHVCITMLSLNDPSIYENENPIFIDFDIEKCNNTSEIYFDLILRYGNIVIYPLSESEYEESYFSTIFSFDSITYFQINEFNNSKWLAFVNHNSEIVATMRDSYFSFNTTEEAFNYSISYGLNRSLDVGYLSWDDIGIISRWYIKSDVQGSRDTPYVNNSLLRDSFLPNDIMNILVNTNVSLVTFGINEIPGYFGLERVNHTRIFCDDDSNDSSYQILMICLVFPGLIYFKRRKNRL